MDSVVYVDYVVSFSCRLRENYTFSRGYLQMTGLYLKLRHLA